MSSLDGFYINTTKRFLKSVVVIDDEADYIRSVAKEIPKVLTAPPTGLTDKIKEEKIADEPSEIVDDSLPSPFDINPVIEGFAKNKIVCNIQRPSKDQEIEKIKEWAINCAEQADITVIDWRLVDKERRLAEDIIMGILEEDQSVGGRLRLICIYTSQSKIENILRDVKERIKEDLKLTIEGNIEDLVLTVDNKVRIVALHKDLPHLTGSDIVSFEDLPERMIQEFSLLAFGIVPSTALHSVAAIRERTHNLLALMASNLDGTFCIHRALIPDVEDSTELLLNLISDEVTSIIYSDRSAHDCSSWGNVKKWITAQPETDREYPILRKKLTEFVKKGNTDLENIRKERALGWIDKHVEAGREIKKSNMTINKEEAMELIRNNKTKELNGCAPPSLNNPENLFAELFYSNSAEAKKACNQLSWLCSTSRDIYNPRGDRVNPFLKLGSILKDEKRDESDYYLCLQPYCDSVRLPSGNTDFLFLKLFKCSGKNNMDLIIKSKKGAFIFFTLKEKGKKSSFSTFSFKPDKTTKRVLLDNLPDKYKWVADLKTNKAISIAQSVLSNASRIGLNEFELLRRKGS